jgi:hypothetical protein
MRGMELELGPADNQVARTDRSRSTTVVSAASEKGASRANPLDRADRVGGAPASAGAAWGAVQADPGEEGDPPWAEEHDRSQATG